ncbi:unnamed protein product [Tenebrio molitor]|nr:unnamed protein product [Tenebrio molitor]
MRVMLAYFHELRRRNIAPLPLIIMDVGTTRCPML